MILKYRTTRKVDEDPNANYDQWNYIDGITDCSVYFDPHPAVNCTCIAFGAGNNHMVLALHDEAYLINENGKTIERISH